MVHRLAPRQQLQQHHPETIDVALGRELARHGVFRGVVTEGAQDTCRLEARRRVGRQAGDVEVADLGVKLVVQEHV